MDPQIVEDIDELVEIVRALKDPMLFADMVHLRAIAMQEFGELAAACGQDASKYSKARSTGHIVLMPKEDCGSDAWMDDFVDQVNCIE